MVLSINSGKQIQKLNCFIEKSIKTHSNKFDYSKVIYVDSKTKVEIICPAHNSFWQDPASHVRGRGCPTCGSMQGGKIRAKDTEWFINQAKEVHGDTYDYSNSSYKNNHTDIEIFCLEHGKFITTPIIHLGGSKCPKCAVLQKDYSCYKRTDEEFIKLSKEKYGDKFNYDDVDYLNKSTKVTINCKEHGDFNVTPRTHLGKSEFGGCPGCTPKTNAGFTKTGWINHCKSKGVEKPTCYIIRLFNNEESFIKIGITTNFYTRVTQFPYKYEIISLIENYPDIVYMKEKFLHKQFKKFKYIPNKFFGGMQECFNLNIYN